eukprot:Pgem_evm1s15627
MVLISHSQSIEDNSSNLIDQDHKHNNVNSNQCSDKYVNKCKLNSNQSTIQCFFLNYIAMNKTFYYLNVKNDKMKGDELLVKMNALYRNIPVPINLTLNCISSQMFFL